MVFGDAWLGWRWPLQRAALVACLLVGALAPQQLEPCSGSPLCSCRTNHMSCIAVPLHRFPEWPQIELEHLDISMSNIEILAESGLDGLKLQTLVLVANKLHHIELHAFSSMAQTLASLDLSYNEFTEIPEQGLRDLKVLNWLNLQNNHIIQVGPEIEWHHLADTLTSLSLSNNQITHLKSQSFSSLCHLLQLDLEGNHLRSISSDSLPPSLTLLKLSNNFIHEFSCDFIYNLPRLKTLHLRHNFITLDIDSGCSDNKTKKMEKLDLSYNKISQFSYMMFHKVHIRQIILDFNEIITLPKLMFANNRIERLSISFNKLSFIGRDLFLSLKNSLEHLEVEHNKLFQLPDSLAQVGRLRHLSLAYNRLEEAPPLPGRIQTLSLAGNFLNSIPSTLQALEPGAIRYLDLSYNKISNLLPNEFLDWSTSLGTINLKGNRIAQIYKNVFPASMPVKEINLSFNDLYYVHPQSFSNVTGSLHVLESSSTLFSGHFPFEIDDGLENLSWLAFDNNDFHILNLSDISNFPNLKYLNLDYNRVVNIVIDKDYHNVSLTINNLNIAYNFLNSVNSRTFAHMLELRNLDLSYNRINNLTKHSFTNLPNLRYLSLAGNIIDFMETETFVNLTKLEILELQGNNITILSLNSFYNVSNKDVTFTVNISRNHIRSIAGENVIMCVSIFDGSYNELVEVPSNLFRSVETTIRQIILSYNKITFVSNDAFGQAIYLEILDLHKNNINIIKRKSFSELTSLQILDLSFNFISLLSVEQFFNLNKLRYLKLDHNNLKLFPRDVFKNTIVEHLDLSFNEISLFPVTALSQIGFTLRYLDLSHNRIEYLDSNIFRNTQFLLNLNVGHNLLTVLSDNTFSSLGGLRQLDLSSNSVKANFKELFHNLPNLRHLNLANIGLKSVPYLPLVNLTVLNLTSNYINSFKETDVKRLVNLRQLDLSYNRITSLVPKMWFHLTALNTLDISYNPILRITPNSFKWLSNLSNLKLNGLKYLDIVDQDSFRPLTSLRFLHIQTWSTINHSTFRIANITSSLSSLYKLVIDWTDDVMENQLHGINARRLRFLEIRGPSLQRISDDAFQPFSECQEIFVRITTTSVTKLPSAFMKHLGQIPQLGVDLSYNQLSTLDPAIFYPNFTSWSHVATKLLSGGFILTGNPLRCDCELAWLGAWLRRWLQENEAGAQLRREVRSATCIDQLGRRIALMQLRTDEAECHASALSSDAQPNYTHFIYILIITMWTLLIR